MFQLRVKEIAEQKNITQARLSRLADVNFKTIQRIYRNPSANVTLDTLDKIATVLEVDLGDLYIYRREERKYSL